MSGTANDLADRVLAHGIRLDNREGTLNSHLSDHSSWGFLKPADYTHEGRNMIPLPALSGPWAALSHPGFPLAVIYRIIPE